MARQDIRAIAREVDEIKNQLNQSQGSIDIEELNTKVAQIDLRLLEIERAYVHRNDFKNLGRRLATLEEKTQVGDGR